jgi:hypothetical protein
MVPLLYNLLLLAADAALLVAVRRRRALPGGLLAALVAAALMLAGLLGENPFGAMRLAAYATFVHGTLMTAITALLVRREAPRTAAVLAALALVTAGVGIDAFFIEPRWLEVSRVKITTPKIQKSYRIVVLSDIQMDHFGEHEQAALAAAMRERPDLLLLPGDYIQAP